MFISGKKEHKTQTKSLIRFKPNGDHLWIIEDPTLHSTGSL
jgi:hypothetical protein